MEASCEVYYAVHSKLDLVDTTAAQLREHFDCHIELLRTGYSTQARQVAANLAKSIGDSSLVLQAKNLPTIRPATRFEPVPQPTARTEEFDTAIESFIEAGYASLDALAAKEKRIAANDTRSSADCRKLVLDYLYESGLQPMWTVSIRDALDLSEEQVIYALEQLKHEDALVGDMGMGSGSWRVRLNAHGRNLADGTATSALPSVVVNQQFHDSPSAVVGINYGNLTQKVRVFPALPDDVGAALAESQAGKELVQALAEARKAPKPAILRSLVTTARTLIECANVTTEVAAHGREWLQAAAHWLSTSHP